MKYLSLLAIAAGSLVAAQSLDKQFTVNLLTKDESLSIVKLDVENQTPLSFNDAPIKHAYDKTIYSVLASFTFDAKDAGQRFYIDNDKWSVNVSQPRSRFVKALITRSTCRSLTPVTKQLNTRTLRLEKIRRMILSSGSIHCPSKSTM